MKWLPWVLCLLVGAGCGAEPTYVSGRVWRDGVPVAGAQVHIVVGDGIADLPRRGATATDAGGRFEWRFDRQYGYYSCYRLVILKDGCTPYVEQFDNLHLLRGGYFVGLLNTQVLNEITLARATP